MTRLTRLNLSSIHLPLIALLLLATPPLQRLLEQSMITHMLVQIPLLVITGWFIGLNLPEHWQNRIAPWNRKGVTGIVFVIFVMAYWMLPRALDDALSEWPVELAKFATLSLAGIALKLSWHQLHPIARGILKLEFWATLMRLGWLYIDLPERLCANYLLSEQRILGQLLLVTGGLWAISWIIQIMFGSQTPTAKSQRGNF